MQNCLITIIRLRVIACEINFQINPNFANRTVKTHYEVYFDMDIKTDKTFRILVARHEEPEVNMVYAEVGGDEYEVFGAFSGISGGGGLFHQNKDGEITVSDDCGEFSSKWGEDVNDICSNLERLRAEFEAYDEDGNMVGLSQKASISCKRALRTRTATLRFTAKVRQKTLFMTYKMNGTWNSTKINLTEQNQPKKTLVLPLPSEPRP